MRRAEKEDAFTWHSADSRYGPKLAAAALAIATVCGAVGFVAGRFSAGPPTASRPPVQTATTVAPSQPAPTQPAAKATRSDDERQEASTQQPPVQLLNPGTASPSAPSPSTTSSEHGPQNVEHVPEPPAKQRSRPAPLPKVADQRDRQPALSRSQDYQALRDYVLGR